MKLSDLIPQPDINAALEGDDEVVAYKIEVAKQGVAYAKSIAPVAEGDYRDGIRVGRLGNSGVAIEFSDWKSHFVEFGTEDQEPNPVRTKTENYLGETNNK